MVVEKKEEEMHHQHHEHGMALHTRRLPFLVSRFSLFFFKYGCIVEWLVGSEAERRRREDYALTVLKRVGLLI